MNFSDAEMVGLCALTECGFVPHEWPYVCQVIYNRVDHPSYPRSVEGVILQPKQFSRFNAFTNRDPDQVFPQLATFYRESQLVAAANCAAWVWTLWTLEPGALLPPTVLHFWSPQSMVPKWSAPSWASKMRWIVPAGIDARRFIFGDSGK
jgi:hypothetical protein